MFKESNSSYPINRVFFLFSFAFFFLGYWILLNTGIGVLAILPALTLALGSSVLLYAVFSILGWAPPLLQCFTAQRLEFFAGKLKSIGRLKVGGFDVGELNVGLRGVNKKVENWKTGEEDGGKLE